MSKRMTVAIVAGHLLFAAGCAMLVAAFLFGCGGTPDLPQSCPVGMHEEWDKCVPTEAVHVDVDYVPNPAPPPPPTKTVVCGAGTHLVNDACLPDDPSIEVCDGKDNNGDGRIDESDPNEGQYCEKLMPLIVGGVSKIVPTRGKLYCAHWPAGPGDPGHGLMCTPDYQPVETCDNHVDDNGDGQVDEGCTPPAVNTIAASTSPDTPSSQTLVMGWIKVELIKFILNFNTQEDVTLDTVTVVDDGDAKAWSAFKNLRLTNGNVEYGSWTNMMPQNNVATVAFGGWGSSGLGVNWVKGNYTVTLSVKADITAYTDGGTLSSHHFRVTDVTATTASGNKVKVTVSTGANEPAGNWMTIRRTNLTVAVAADSPSGLQIPATEQVIAKFVVSNTANVGNYAAYMGYLKVTIDQGNVFPKNTWLKLRVYDTSVAANSVLIDSSNVYAGTITYSIYAGIPVLEVLAGKSRNLIVTLDTANATFGSPNGLQVKLDADAISWQDGAGSYSSVDSLPLQAGNLTF